MKGSSHQGGVHRGDEADQDVGQGDQDVQGSLHVAQELIRGVSWSARESTQVRVAGGDGDQLPVLVHVDRGGQGLQPPHQVLSLVCKIVTGGFPAGQVEPAEGERALGGSLQRRVELPQQVRHRCEAPPISSSSHGKGDLGIVLENTHSRVCKSCRADHHVVTKAGYLKDKDKMDSVFKDKEKMDSVFKDKEKMDSVVKDKEKMVSGFSSHEPRQCPRGPRWLP